MSRAILRGLVRDAAVALGDELAARVVFVGGTLPGILIDDPGAMPPRVTRDVDVVVEVPSVPAY